MRRALFVVALLGCAGCGSTATFHVITGTPGRPTRVDPRVYLEGAALPSDYAEVAIVQAVGRGTHADLEHVVEGVRAEAAALGCDAVIATHADSGQTQSSATGVAVRWTAGPPPTPTPTRAVGAAVPWTPPGATVVAPWATPQP